ncbi:MAG: hypothetical protein JO130_18675 [Solirubrobacterales bacterium]|nr:hypothetical protein [Solirubrobacterales bacterium]
MSISHLRIAQAGVVALLTTIIGQVVAFVPAFAPDKQILVSAASTVIAAVFLVANAIHALIATKVSGKDLEGDVVSLAKAEVDKLDVNALVHDAVAGENIEQLVKDELNRILVVAGLATKVGAVPPAPTPAVAVPPAPAPVHPFVTPPSA